MFGTYRLILAFMVVFLHLAGWPGFGEYAVFTFFCLSGYLMTYIMHENYGYTGKGLKKYALARFLRIYPLYFCACLFGIAALLSFGEANVTYLIYNLKWPDSFTAGFSNSLLLFFDRKEIALVPPAWALTVELFYYALIGLGISKTHRRTLIWFTLAVIYTLSIFIFKLEWWDYGYFHPLAGSLPFACGALMYHNRDRITQLIRPFSTLPFAIGLYLVVLANWAINYKLGTYLGIGFYINLLLNVLLLALLTNVKLSNPLLKRFDKACGDLSYPVYLIHWAVGIFVFYLAAMVGFELDKKTELFAIVATPFILLVAQLTVWAIHIPLEHVRERIKKT